jgi:hypothetical protein
MNAYFCIICGRNTHQYARCPSCGGDEQQFIRVNNPVEKDILQYSGNDIKKDLRQRLFTARLSKYLA